MNHCCTGSSGTIVLLTSKAPLCGTLNLNLLGLKRNVLHTIPMSGCGQIFSGNATFPSGTYRYQISGTDSLGTPILINLQKKVTFQNSKYTFNIEHSNDLMELKPQGSADVSVSIRNENLFPSTFTISAKIRGLSIHTRQVEVTVPGDTSSTVTVPVSVPESVSRGFQTLTLTAENGCITLTAEKNVSIVKVCFKTITYVGAVNCRYCLVYTIASLTGRLHYCMLSSLNSCTGKKTNQYK